MFKLPLWSTGTSVALVFNRVAVKRDPWIPGPPSDKLWTCLLHQRQTSLDSKNRGCLFVNIFFVHKNNGNTIPEISLVGTSIESLQLKQLVSPANGSPKVRWLISIPGPKFHIYIYSIYIYMYIYIYICTSHHISLCWLDIVYIYISTYNNQFKQWFPHISPIPHSSHGGSAKAPLAKIRVLSPRDQSPRKPSLAMILLASARLPSGKLK